MKYLKLYEDLGELIKDIDPFDEDDWDEVDDIEEDKYYFIILYSEKFWDSAKTELSPKLYQQLQQNNTFTTKTEIQKGKLSDEDNSGGRYLLDEGNNKITYMRNNLQKLYDMGYILLKNRVKPPIAIAKGKELIDAFKNIHNKKQNK